MPAPISIVQVASLGTIGELANVEAYLATHTDHHLQAVLVGMAG